MYEMDDVRKDRKVVAMLLLDTARNISTSVMIGEKKLLLPQLMGDQQLMAALLKIGLFSAGAQSFSAFTLTDYGPRIQGDPMLHTPAGMIAMAFAYAARCFDGRSKKEIVSHSRRIEKKFGQVPLDPILMGEISSLAQEKEAS